YPELAVVVNLGKPSFLVGQFRETFHRLFRMQGAVPYPLQHFQDGFRLHDRDPASRVVPAGSRLVRRVCHAVNAACITTFSGTSKAAAARRQSSYSGAAFHSSPCQEPLLMWITPKSVCTGVSSRARMTRRSSRTRIPNVVVSRKISCCRRS